MTLTNDDLLALSQLMDDKLHPIEKRLDKIEDRLVNVEDRLVNVEDRLVNVEHRLTNVEMKVAGLEKDVNWLKLETRHMKKELTELKICQETWIVPRLSNIEACYLGTSVRYQESADKVDAVCEDVELLKKVVSEHSEKLRKIKAM